MEGGSVMFWGGGSGGLRPPTYFARGGRLYPRGGAPSYQLSIECNIKLKFFVAILTYLI